MYNQQIHVKVPRRKLVQYFTDSYHTRCMIWRKITQKQNRLLQESLFLESCKSIQRKLLCQTFTLWLIKLNLLSSFRLDMTRRYFTVFAIKSQPRELTAFWKIKRKLLIEKKEADTELFVKNSCMLEEAVTKRSSRSQMLLVVQNRCS